MADPWLPGWKAIANYCGLSVRTVQRQHERYGMPVRRLPEGKPIAIKYELDGWLSGMNTKAQYRIFAEIRRLVEETRAEADEMAHDRAELVRNILNRFDKLIKKVDGA
jgi:hypothetical protein